MTNGSIVIVVGASVEEFDHVKQCLSDWECLIGPLNDEKTSVPSLPTTAKLIIVYAQKE